jgi:hypothetical protein
MSHRRRDKLRLGAGSLIVAAMTATGSLTVAQAVPIAIPLPTLATDFGVSFSPTRMPRKEQVPVGARIKGKVGTKDGSHPSALRKALVDTDRDLSINVQGLPICQGGQRESLDTKEALKRCGKALIGRGNARFAIAFPEYEPLIVKSPVTVFNAGEREGEIRLLIHAFIRVPRPAAVVAVATIKKKDGGYHAVVRIPVIAGGAGSLIGFQIGFDRTYTHESRRTGLLEGRCPKGMFEFAVPRMLFRNEARVPNVAATTVLKGVMVVPCTPKG